MEKLICLICMVVLLLTGCSAHPSQESPSNLSEKIHFMESLTKADTPILLPIQYDTVEELITSINSEFTDEILTEIELAEPEENEGNFRSFIVESKKEKELFVPYYQDEPVVLRDEVDLPSIDLSCVDMYGQPWIWYHVRHHDQDIKIMTMSLTPVLNTETILETEEKGISWLINQVDSEAPTEKNAKSYTAFESVYEQEIALQHRNVNALFVKQKDDARVRITFMFEDVLVSVWGQPEVVTSEWFTGLDFKSTLVDK